MLFDSFGLGIGVVGPACASRHRNGSSAGWEFIFLTNQNLIVCFQHRRRLLNLPNVTTIMSSTTTTNTQTSNGHLNLVSDPAASDAATHYGDWRDDFYRDGYYVLKQAVAPEKAAEYKKDMLAWLTTFKRGFSYEDKSTWTAEHLPINWKGGMYLHYCAAHEDFVWKARM